MKKIYKVGNEDIEIGAHAPKITGFHPDTRAPIFEGQVIEERKEFYVYATPMDRLMALLINLSISFIFNLLFSIFLFISYNQTQVPLLFGLGTVHNAILTSLFFTFYCNVGMIINKMYIYDKKHYEEDITGKKFRGVRGTVRLFGLRTITLVISLLIPFVLIISLVCLFKTKKHQMLHDIILNQYIVKKIK